MADSYPPASELVADSDEQALTSLSPEEQEDVRQSAIAAVEEFCSQPFALDVEILVIDGYGADVLYLPKRLEELAALGIDGQPWPTDAVVLSEDHSRLHRSPSVGIGYYEQAMAEVSGEQFPLGFGNVAIDGSWGWAEIPENIITAVRWDMEDTAVADASPLAGTVRAYRKLGIRTIAQGNLTADMTGTPSVSDRVAQLLRPYQWQGQVGALA